MAVWMLSPAPTLMVAPWVLISNRAKVRRKARLNFFIIRKILFHGGSGGFNGDGASCGHGNRGDIQTKHNGFIGRPPIGNKIVPAKHTNVIAGTIPVIVLRIGRAGVDAGGVGCFGVNVTLMISTIPPPLNLGVWLTRSNYCTQHPTTHCRRAVPIYLIK